MSANVLMRTAGQPLPITAWRTKLPAVLNVADSKCLILVKPPQEQLDGILEALASKSQPAREALFQAMRERFCVFCGAARATYKCYCHATGEDV